MAVRANSAGTGAGLRSAFLLQLAGAVLPALVMLLSVPLIRVQLDMDRFAAFTVLLSAVGLLAVLDGGLGRASTYFMSLALKSGLRRRAVPVFHGILLVGAVFSVVLAVVGTVAVQAYEGAAAGMARPALEILVIFAPVFVVGALLRGFLEAEGRFAVSSALQVVYGTAVGLVPVALFHFSDDLRLLAWWMGLLRGLLVLAQWYCCGLMRRENWHVARTASVHARRVLRYAQWLFLSNLVGLSIVFADRFLVGALFSSAVVAAYVLPMEMVARLQILVNAFCSALFPRLVSARPQPGGAGAQWLADAQGALLSAALLLGGLVALLAPPLMGWWLGAEAARLGTGVLAVGIVGSGLIAGSALAMLLVNSRGLTRPVALLHVAELPLYLGLLYGAARAASIELLLGVWLLRLAVDALVMTQIALRSAAPAAARRALRGLAPWCALGAGLAALLGGCLLSPGPPTRQGPVLGFALAMALVAASIFLTRLRVSARLSGQRFSRIS